MLGDEDRMTTHGSLFAVTRRMRRCEAFGDERCPMLHDNIKAPAFQIESGLIVQMKA